MRQVVGNGKGQCVSNDSANRAAATLKGGTVVPVTSNVQGTVDGGSEFMADFKAERASLGLPLFVLPPR